MREDTRKKTRSIHRAPHVTTTHALIHLSSRWFTRLASLWTESYSPKEREEVSGKLFPIQGLRICAWKTLPVFIYA